MTFNTKLVAYGIAALAFTAVADVLTGLGPFVLMCAYAGIVAAWAIEPGTSTPRTNVDLKKAA
jgi:hypothetical protein